MLVMAPRRTIKIAVGTIEQGISQRVSIAQNPEMTWVAMECSGSAILQFSCMFCSTSYSCYEN